MGMYDTLRCHYPLPGIEMTDEGIAMQTKSLGCWMDDFILTVNGLLFWMHRDGSVERRMFHGDISATLLGVEMFTTYIIRMTEGVVSGAWRTSP